MLQGLTILLVYQTVGEIIVQLARLPVPGPVVGMLLLCATLALRGELPQPWSDAAQGILRHLSLLFVPACVGIMLHFQRLAEEWLPIAVAVVASTLLTIVVTALVTELMLRRAARRSERGSP